MAIQWFPGHMHLTRKAITERIKETDVVIELLDARLPGSSANPMLTELIQNVPTLKVLNKQDLADPLRTEAWLAHYNALAHTRAIGLDASETAPARRLIEACRLLAPNRGSMVKPMRVLICGVPNVGKSTLINTLTGKRAAKTGDEAGITKQEQRIVLADGFYLYDTPGVLWPRIGVPQSGFHLAASGAMGRNAYDDVEVAHELIANLLRQYPQALLTRYKLGEGADTASTLALTWSPDDLLQAIGRKRGAVLSGNRVDLQKAAEIVIHEFRSGTLGRITLETPAEYAEWVQISVIADAERQERQVKKKKKRPVE